MTFHFTKPGSLAPALETVIAEILDREEEKGNRDQSKGAHKWIRRHGDYIVMVISNKRMDEYRNDSHDPLAMAAHAARAELRVKECNAQKAALAEELAALKDRMRQDSKVLQELSARWAGEEAAAQENAEPEGANAQEGPQVEGSNAQEAAANARKRDRTEFERQDEAEQPSMPQDSDKVAGKRRAVAAGPAAPPMPRDADKVAGKRPAVAAGPAAPPVPTAAVGASAGPRPKMPTITLKEALMLNPQPAIFTWGPSKDPYILRCPVEPCTLNGGSGFFDVDPMGRSKRAWHHMVKEHGDRSSTKNLMKEHGTKVVPSNVVEKTFSKRIFQGWAVKEYNRSLNKTATSAAGAGASTSAAGAKGKHNEERDDSEHDEDADSEGDGGNYDILVAHDR